MRDFGYDQIGRRQRRLHLGNDDFLGGWRIKRDAPGQCVVKRRPEAVHVGQKGFGLAFDFFRRDIIRRAPGHVIRFLLLVGFLRQTEVHQFRFVIRIEQNVARLDVAVEQIVFERHVERGGDFDADVEHVEFRQHAQFFDARVQAAPVGQFHDQVTLAFRLVKGVDMNDVRVIEPGTGAGLPVETFQRIRIFQQLLLHQFHRHQAFQRRVPGAIDVAHAAGTNDAAQFELPQLHRHHDRVPTLVAGHRAKRRQVAGDENLRFTPAACDHAQRFVAHAGNQSTTTLPADKP